MTAPHRDRSLPAFSSWRSSLSCPASPRRRHPRPPATDANTPLHLLKPDYPVPYGPTSAANVTEVLQRVRGYLEAKTPARMVDRATGQPIADPAAPSTEAAIEPGAFRVTSYEWGVVYSGMLLASETTGDPAFKDYVARRLTLVARLADHYRAHPVPDGPLRSVLEPHALDDAGSLCAAMIKATRAGVAADLRPMIDNFIGFISTKEFRLADGTLARNRPQPSTLWLDDLYMSVPALAQMGKLTGERRYYDDAVKQVLQFSRRMFNREQGLFMHGWVQGMEVHPEFRWARANGWALMTLVELLDVLPDDHPDRAAVVDLLRAHVRGLAARQSGSGFWHQLWTGKTRTSRRPPPRSTPTRWPGRSTGAGSTRWPTGPRPCWRGTRSRPRSTRRARSRARASAPAWASSRPSTTTVQRAPSRRTVTDRSSSRAPRWSGS